jgi:hypothetical protein
VHFLMKAEASLTAVDVGRRKDRLQELPFIHDDPGIPEAANLRMRPHNFMQQGGTALVQPAYEYKSMFLHWFAAL